MNRLLCLDLDGTLIEGHVRPKPEGGFEEIQPFEAVVPLPKVRDVLHWRLEDGWRIAICTNKAGVAFGHHTVSDCHKKAKLVLAELNLPSIGSEELSWHEAYGHPSATITGYRFEDPERKPRPGMLLAAMARHGAEPLTTTMVGDMQVDSEAAMRAGTKFEWAHDFFVWDGPRG